MLGSWDVGDQASMAAGSGAGDVAHAPAEPNGAVEGPPLMLQAAADSATASANARSRRWIIDIRVAEAARGRGRARMRVASDATSWGRVIPASVPQGVTC